MLDSIENGQVVCFLHANVENTYDGAVRVLQRLIDRIVGRTQYVRFPSEGATLLNHGLINRTACEMSTDRTTTIGQGYVGRYS